MPEVAGNELDAALVWRNQLLVLECKTGVQISTEGGSRVTGNRLDSLRRHVGGVLGETWLVTARRLQQGPDCAARERARAYRIRLIEPEQLVHLLRDVCDWMGLGTQPVTPSTRRAAVATDFLSCGVGEEPMARPTMWRVGWRQCMDVGWIAHTQRRGCAFAVARCWRCRFDGGPQVPTSGSPAAA